MGRGMLPQQWLPEHCKVGSRGELCDGWGIVEDILKGLVRVLRLLKV